MNHSDKNWDFVVSCYEPLGSVTGGIGTYTRLLLHQLSSIHESILGFTASDIDLDLPSNVTLVQVRNTAQWNGRSPNNLPDAHFAYSFHLAQQLLHMQTIGHRFTRTEFPDYGNDGFFAMSLRKAGALDLGHVSIRLHSPSLMLRKDNCWPDFLAPLDLVMRSRALRAERSRYDPVWREASARASVTAASCSNAQSPACEIPACAASLADAGNDTITNAVKVSGSLVEVSGHGQHRHSRSARGTERFIRGYESVGETPRVCAGSRYKRPIPPCRRYHTGLDGTIGRGRAQEICRSGWPIR
jgi:hypothetical protein